MRSPDRATHQTPGDAQGVVSPREREVRSRNRATHETPGGVDACPFLPVTDPRPHRAPRPLPGRCLRCCVGPPCWQVSPLTDNQRSPTRRHDTAVLEWRQRAQRSCGTPGTCAACAVAVRTCSGGGEAHRHGAPVGALGSWGAVYVQRDSASQGRLTLTLLLVLGSPRSPLPQVSPPLVAFRETVFSAEEAGEGASCRGTRIVEATTPNGACTVRVRALPLPGETACW